MDNGYGANRVRSLEYSDVCKNSFRTLEHKIEYQGSNRVDYNISGWEGFYYEDKFKYLDISTGEIKPMTEEGVVLSEYRLISRELEKIDYPVGDLLCYLPERYVCFGEAGRLCYCGYLVAGDYLLDFGLFGINCTNGKFLDDLSEMFSLVGPVVTIDPNSLTYNWDTFTWENKQK